MIDFKPVEMHNLILTTLFHHIILWLFNGNYSSIRFITHCIDKFVPIAELVQVEWAKSPSWVVSSDSNRELGTTCTPCMPSRALQGFNVLWGLINFSVVSQSNFNASKNLLATAGRGVLSVSQCIDVVYHCKTTAIFLRIKSTTNHTVDHSLKFNLTMH